MSYKKCYQGKKLGNNYYEMHLWEQDGEHQIIPYNNIAYQECSEESHSFRGLNGEFLKPTSNWFFSKNPNYSSKNTPGLHFQDMKPHQKFLVERYGVNDTPSTGHREVFFDIECEIGGALTEEYIESAPMPITSIAWWDKTPDTWHILILDKKSELKHTKTRNKEIIPCKTENELLAKFVELFREMDPDILVGYNCIPKTSRIWKEDEIIEIENLPKTTPLHGGNNRVLRYVSSNMKNQYNILLENGNIIKSSIDHIFPVYEKISTYQSLNPLLGNLSDKSVKDMMGNNNDLYLEVVKGSNPNNDQNMSLVGGEDITSITNDDLYLLGLIFTDGWYHNEKNGDKNTISVSNSCVELIENIIPIANIYRRKSSQIENINQLKPHQSKLYPNAKPNYRFRMFSKNSHGGKFKLLKKLIYGGDDKKSLNINLLSKLSKKQFSSFFSGCIDGDGSVNNKFLSFCNYEGNIPKVHELLLWNGVYSTIESSEKNLNIPYTNIFNNKTFIEGLSFRGYKRDQQKTKIKYFEFKNKPSCNAKKYVLEDKVLVRIKEIIDTKEEVDMCDITTSTGYFIYKGVKTHNCDYFDIPYLYYRMCRTIGKDWADHLSPIGQVVSKKNNKYFYKQNQYVDIVGVESLDYMRLHKKYHWKDEPSWKLDAIGEKYVGMNKIEYDGNLDQLFATDIHKFIQYNFVDVEILQKLDEKLQYIALTKNLAHKGKHNYSEVYANSITQDGAISAYLLSQNIIPPPKEPNPQKKDTYAGGYLFCPKAGLYKYMFDEDLTSLYPSIIMSINIGKETFVGSIIDADDRNSRLGFNDLKEMDSKNLLLVENSKRRQTNIEVGELIKIIESQKLAISANGSMFRTDKESVLSTILKKWFEERVEYKKRMQKAYKAGDKEEGDHWHRYQLCLKILLNSLYGATALPSFRYSMNNQVLSEAITLSGHRIICESALCVNKHMNKVIRSEELTEEFRQSLDS